MKVQGPNVFGTQLNSSTLGQSPAQVRPGENQGVALLLFGKRPPRLLNPRRLTKKQQKGLRKLKTMEEQLCDVMGVAENTFEVALCEGDNACVGQDGLIRFGEKLLEEHGEDHDLLMAIMAHEMGHQPWTWPKGNLAHLKKSALKRLYREEEARADSFAGKALAAMGLSPDSVERFLLRAEAFEGGQSEEYYPAQDRAALIRAEWKKEHRRIVEGARFNPRALERTREIR